MLILVLLLVGLTGLPALAQEAGFPRPQITPLAESAGFNDSPSMVRAADGSYYVAWVSFRDGWDTLQVARYERVGEMFQSRGAWQVAGGKGVYVLGPRLAATGDGAYLVYAQEAGRNWEIFAVRCGAKGPMRPFNLSNHPGSDSKPAAWWHNDTLWVAWESNRDNMRRILMTAVRGDKPGPAEQVSGESKSNYSPAIAVNPGGVVSVAWHSFRSNNYDVLLRQRRPDGSWSGEQKVTSAPSIDRHAVLNVQGADWWLAYENAQMEGYAIGRTNQRALVLG